MKKLTATIVTNEGTQLFGIDGNILSVNFGALDRGDISDTTNWGVFTPKTAPVKESFFRDFSHFGTRFRNFGTEKS